MEHLRIWIQIITLIVGAVVLAYTHQLHKRRGIPFLRPIFWCFLFLNLGFLVSLLSEYLLVNFFQNLIALKTSLYMELVDPVGSLLFVGLVYSLITLSYSLREKNPPGLLVWAAAGAAGVITVKVALESILAEPSFVLRAFDAAHIATLVLAFLIVCGLLGYLAVGGRGSDSKETKAALRVLGLFFLFGCVGVLFSAAFAGSYHGIIRTSICLGFNIFPLFWYRRYLLAFGNGLADAVTVDGLDAFFEEHGVSNRQGEIIELLLQGKSNRDIADALFIAPHTVKNHIYGLYQKLHIKSRYELVSMVLGQSK